MSLRSFSVDRPKDQACAVRMLLGSRVWNETILKSNFVWTRCPKKCFQLIRKRPTPCGPKSGQSLAMAGPNPPRTASVAGRVALLAPGISPSAG